MSVLAARALTWSLVAILATVALVIRPSNASATLDTYPGQVLSMDRVPTLAPTSVLAVAPPPVATHRTFLSAPLNFLRISSGFGMRMHPVLGIWLKHEGTDYVAPEGTPVHAVADGVITFVGWKGGYGKFVQIQHKNGLVTRYGHLARFAADTHEGATVKAGDTIAFVGMTGLATAPHLHFEALVDGVARNPVTILAQAR